jgi:protein ImuB
VVCLEDAPRPECLLLDVMGTAAFFGGEASLTVRLQQAFAERGLQVRVALAGTIGAAWALAHHGKDRPLISLPVAALRLSDETVARLESLGIEQIGQLAALPRGTLSSRFGVEVLLRLDQALGHLPEALVSQHAPPEFIAEWPLEYPTDRQETINFVLETLINRLTAQLAARREGVLRLECRFDLQSGPPLRISVGLFRPAAMAKHLFDLIQLQLEKHRLRTLVQAIRLTVMATAPLELEQLSLFDEGEDRASPRHLAALVDRLASRLGREAVLRPKLLADAQPEHACQYVPLHQAATGGRASATIRRGLMLRPLQLFEPVALQATAVMPEGPPIRFHAADGEQRVVHVWGPERIETGWWRKHGVRRDYYRVETHTGQRFWLFRRRQDGRWFCQGAF